MQAGRLHHEWELSNKVAAGARAAVTDFVAMTKLLGAKEPKEMEKEMVPSSIGAGLRKTTWRDSAAWGRVLLLAYVLLAVLPVALAYLLSPVSGQSLLRNLGKDAALLGFSLLVMQSVLSARFHGIDRAFGLDRVMVFHKATGIFAGALILLHPVLLALNHRSWSLFRLDTSWPITVGKVALLLLVLIILFALLFRRFHVDYNVWRIGHKAAVLVVVLGFVHGMIVGSDLHNPGMSAYWTALLAVVILLFLYRNAYVPLFGRRRLRVAAVTRESHDTWTLAFESEPGGRAIQHRPGQFWFLKLVRPGRSSEQHPFTISSSPTGEPPITSTIKASGNFTRTIGDTRVGDKARIEGPFGRFSLVNHSAQAFLFIAGGVGITPIMSMLRYLRDTGDARPAALIWGNKTEADILFRKELETISTQVKVTHVLSAAEPSWHGLKGYVTPELIRQAAGELLGTAEVYVCGPPVMMDKVIGALKELGVAKVRIHYERFTI